MPATMATSQASVRKLHATSCRMFPANKTAKDSPRRFDPTNNEFPEMPPKWSTQGKLKAQEIRTTVAPTTHHAAWSHQMSVVLMTHSRKTYFAAVRSRTGVGCSFTYRRENPISSSLHDYLSGAGLVLAYASLHRSQTEQFPPVWLVFKYIFTPGRFPSG